MTLRRFAVLALLPLAGCPAFQAGVSTLPSELGQLEQTKAAIAIAPLAGCITEIQQTKMLMNAMEMGTPAIPVSPNAPPIMTVPTQPPVTTPPSPSGGPIVTPTQRLHMRHRAASQQATLENMTRWWEETHPDQ